MQPKIVGTVEEAVKIDDTYVCGQRKYEKVICLPVIVPPKTIQVKSKNGTASNIYKSGGSYWIPDELEWHASSITLKYCGIIVSFIGLSTVQLTNTVTLLIARLNVKQHHKSSYI